MYSLEIGVSSRLLVNWLECNKRVFEGCSESVYSIFCSAKELACFWGMTYNQLGDYSVMNIKRDWGQIFSCA